MDRMIGDQPLMLKIANSQQAWNYKDGPDGEYMGKIETEQENIILGLLSIWLRNDSSRFSFHQAFVPS